MTISFGGLVLPKLVLVGISAAVDAGTQVIAATETVEPASDPAMAARLVVRDVTDVSGTYRAALIAQLVDAAGDPTSNGGTPVALSLTPGPGASLSSTTQTTTPDGAPGVPSCAGPGTAGMTPTSARWGEVLCELTSTVSDPAVTLADAASAFERPQPMVGIVPGEVSSVGAAAYDAYVVTASGGVLAVGENPLGELGTGSSQIASATPVWVALPSGARVAQVAGGGYFALALTSVGSVLAWGQNDQGQLGLGTTSTDVGTPQVVSLPVAATKVAAGCNAAYALGSNGTVYAWGANYAGQLGDGSRAQADAPVAVSLPVAATAIAATCNGGYALGSNGVLYAWGSNNAGQLGDGSIGGSVSTPVAVDLPAGVSVAQLSSQNSGGYALGSNGVLYAWGAGSLGQLGDGRTANADLPVVVKVPSVDAVAQVVGGGFNAFAVTTTGRLLAWGGNYDGQDGTGGLANVLVPTPVDLPASVVSVSGASAGGFAAIALAANGVVYTWGANFDDELGIGVLTTNYFSLALTANGLEGWGSAPSANFDAEPGGIATPAPIAGPAGATALAAGAGSAYALTSSGDLYAWGANDAGQLGDGTTLASASPVAVSLPVAATQVAASCQDAYALGANGVVYAWGANDAGQLGDGTRVASLEPVAVSTPSGVRAIAAGRQDAYALGANGVVYAWGANNAGQLGDGTTAERDVPGAVALTSSATAVWAGGGQAFAATSRGLMAWGDNTTGQLGTGGFFDNLVPEPVALPAGTSVVAVSSPGVSTLILTSAGAVFAVGGNLFGQLGDGSYFTTANPQEIATGSVSALAMGGFANWLEPFSTTIGTSRLDVRL